MTQYLTSAPGPDVPAPLCNSLTDSTSYAAKRFAIYKNNVYARLVDALRDTFPAVEKLVGVDFFRYAAVEYITSRPARSGPLIAYGTAFPDFLTDFAPAADISYLGDIARLELLYLESYHAADAPASSATSVGLPRETDRPALHPSVRIMTSPLQISRIWELNRNDVAFENIHFPLHREYLLVMRPALQVEVRRVSLGIYAALLAFVAGASVSEARAEAIWASPQMDFSGEYAQLHRSGVFAKTPGKDITS